MAEPMPAQKMIIVPANVKARYAELVAHNKKLEAELLKLLALNKQVSKQLTCSPRERKQRAVELQTQINALLMHSSQLSATLRALKDDVDMYVLGHKTSGAAINARIAELQRQLAEKDDLIRHLNARINNASVDIKSQRSASVVRKIVYHHTDHKDRRFDLAVDGKEKKIAALLGEIGQLRSNNERLRANVQSVRSLYGDAGTPVFVHKATLVSDIEPISFNKASERKVSSPYDADEYEGSYYGLDDAPVMSHRNSKVQTPKFRDFSLGVLEPVTVVSRGLVPQPCLKVLPGSGRLIEIDNGVKEVKRDSVLRKHIDGLTGMVSHKEVVSLATIMREDAQACAQMESC